MFHPTLNYTINKKTTDEGLKNMVNLLQDPSFRNNTDAQNAVQEIRKVTVQIG